MELSDTRRIYKLLEKDLNDLILIYFFFQRFCVLVRLSIVIYCEILNERET